MKVYKFRDDRNLIEDNFLEKSLLADERWHFILGIDFGWNDASALVIMAYNQFNPNVYVIHSESHTQWTLTDVANRVHQLNSVYHFAHMVGDSAAKQSIMELSKHHSLPIKPTKKVGTKAQSIAHINADFTTGSIKIDPIQCKSLLDEMQKLIWDPNKFADGKYEELASLPNHECDAFNYAYFLSKHYRNIQEEKPLNLDKREDIFEMLKRNGMIKKSSDGVLGRSIFDHQKTDQEVINDFRNSIGKKTW